MGNLLQTTIVFVLVLGGMIVIHEFGHFIVAKLFGIRVDVFSVGFGKRLFGIKKGDTDYRLSLIPLGGYVKMAGENLTNKSRARLTSFNPNRNGSGSVRGRRACNEHTDGDSHTGHPRNDALRILYLYQ